MDQAYLNAHLRAPEGHIWHQHDKDEGVTELRRLYCREDCPPAASVHRSETSDGWLARVRRPGGTTYDSEPMDKELDAIHWVNREVETLHTPPKGYEWRCDDYKGQGEMYTIREQKVVCGYRWDSAGVYWVGWIDPKVLHPHFSTDTDARKWVKWFGVVRPDDAEDFEWLDWQGQDLDPPPEGYEWNRPHPDSDGGGFMTNLCRIEDGEKIGGFGLHREGVYMCWIYREITSHFVTDIEARHWAQWFFSMFQPEEG